MDIVGWLYAHNAFVPKGKAAHPRCGIHRKRPFHDGLQAIFQNSIDRNGRVHGDDTLGILEPTLSILDRVHGVYGLVCVGRMQFVGSGAKALEIVALDKTL